MVRGVHRKIIEVVDPQDEYFEKAILFVRDPARAGDPAGMQQRAEAYLAQLRRSFADRGRAAGGPRWKAWLAVLGVLALGVLGVVLFF